MARQRTRSPLHRTPQRRYPHQTPLRWVESHPKQVSQLSEPAVLRSVLATIGTRIDGSAAAPSVASKRRRVLFNALEYAVERGVIPVNPLSASKWRPPKSSGAIDKRLVINSV